MTKKTLRIFPVLIILFLAAFLSEAKAQTITGSIGTVKRGGSVKGTITMTIPDGLHVNSNRPNNKYAIPTTLKITATDGARISRLVYPRGKNKKFGFSDEAINVYEGRIVFSFNLSVPKDFRKSTVPVRVAARFQACTDEVCYPPRTREITLTARVK
jgi:thiol:disulfide interchange protein